MGLFFTPESQLPDDVGFSPMGSAHIFILLLILTATVLLFLVFTRLPEQGRRRLYWLMALALPLFELLKDFILALIGAFSVGYLPLHLCSLGMFVCLYYARHPESDFCGQLLYSVVFPGALAALLFPDWCRFPVLHFQSLHSFLYHGMLMQLSLLPLIAGAIRPGLRQIPKSLIFLLCVSVPVYGMNRLLHTNYMFLSQPAPGSPLGLFAKIPGSYGYLGGYFLLVLAVIFLLNLPFSIFSPKPKAPPKSH